MALTAEQVEHFHTHGYVAVPDLLDPETDIDPVLREYDTVLDRLAERLVRDGRLSDTYAGLPFGERMAKVYSESGEIHWQWFDITLPLVATLDTPMWLGPAVFDILRHPALLDVAESLIGPELLSNPVQHVRIKPPQRLMPESLIEAQPAMGATPWHQDQGVITADADDSDVLTVWVAVTDAYPENGCLQVIPGSHREGLREHCPNRQVSIPPGQLPATTPVPVPLRRGGAIFMHRLTCHGSLPNVSDEIRWSFDLRYNPVGQPTGRSLLPGFVARSRRDPARELRDPEAWRELWLDARRRLAGGDLTVPPSRWATDSPMCA